MRALQLSDIQTVTISSVTTFYSVPDIKIPDLLFLPRAQRGLFTLVATFSLGRRFLKINRNIWFVTPSMSEFLHLPKDIHPIRCLMNSFMRLLQIWLSALSPTPRFICTGTFFKIMIIFIKLFGVCSKLFRQTFSCFPIFISTETVFLTLAGGRMILFLSLVSL